MDARAVVVCLFVVLAGCSGGGTGTATPLDVPAVGGDRGGLSAELPADATPRPNATIDGVGYPPGTDDRGILNGSTVLAATDRAVATGDAAFRFNRTFVGERETTVDVVTTRVDDETDRLLGATRERERGDARGNWTNAYTVYANESVAAIEQSGDRRRSYEWLDGDNVTTLRGTASVSAARRLLEAPYGRQSEATPDGDIVAGVAFWQPTGTTAVGGETAVVFEVTGADGAYTTIARPDGNVTVTGTIAVTPDGVLRRGVVRYTAAEGEQTVVHRYRLDTSDVTVERPAWLDELDR